MSQSCHLFLPKAKLDSCCYSFTCCVKILGNYLKTEKEEKHKAQNISIHCLPWPDSLWKQKIQWWPFERVKNIQSIMLTTTVGVILFFFFPFSQESTSSLPPTVSDCLRADVRIPVAHSQNCSNYPEGLDLTYGFLYPPSEHCSFYSWSLESLNQLDVGLCLNI